MLDKIFSKEICNTGRQIEIDVLRTWLLIDLILCHCFIYCSSDERLLTGIPYAYDSVIGGPLCAPCFMLCMGIGMVYTKHNTARDFAKRGLMLAPVAFLLNICRFTIPGLIGYAITGEKETYLPTVFYETFENDILMFASLSFLTMALFKHFNLKPWIIVIIGLVMSGITTLIGGIDLGSPAANIIVGHFIGTEDAAEMVCSYFTLFNWFAITAIGYLYGTYYQRVKDKKLFHLVIGVPALILAITYFAIRMPARVGVFGEGQICYYHASTVDMLGSAISAIARLAICYFISLILPDALKEFMKKTSSNVTASYCIQWVLVIVISTLFLYIIRGTSELSDFMIIILGICICVVSIVGARCYKAFLLSRRKTNEKE